MTLELVYFLWATQHFMFLFVQGENVQLQMELSRMDKVKSNLTAELARLSREAEKLEVMTEQLEDVRKLYQETESKYQTMLTVSYPPYCHSK